LNRKGGGCPGGEEGSRPGSAAEDPGGAAVEEAAHEPGGSAREGGRVAGALSMAEMEATRGGASNAGVEQRGPCLALLPAAGGIDPPSVAACPLSSYC